MTRPVETAPETAEAFEAFLRAHYDRIYRQAFRVLGNAADAEDLTQEIAMALPEKLKSFQGKSSLSTWLYRVVSNAALDKKRQAMRVRNNKAIWADYAKIVSQPDTREQADSDWLWSAIRKLDDTLMMTAFLLFDQELSQAQAAEVMEISPGTVSWRVSELKKALRAAAKSEEFI